MAYTESPVTVASVSPGCKDVAIPAPVRKLDAVVCVLLFPLSQYAIMAFSRVTYVSLFTIGLALLTLIGG